MRTAWPTQSRSFRSPIRTRGDFRRNKSRYPCQGQRNRAWCEPCREELPKLAAYEAKLRGRGFVLITISADEPEQHAAAYAFLLKSGVRLPGYRKQTENDSAFIDFIDRKWSGALPTLFLYGRDGAKVKSFIGETEMDEIEQAVGKLL